MKQLFCCISISLLLCSPLSGLERLTIIPDYKDLPLTSVNANNFNPSTQLVFCVGTISGIYIPTPNHLTLYSSEGKQIPLHIDKNSLIYQSDRIISLKAGFFISQPELSHNFTLFWDTHESQENNQLFDHPLIYPDPHTLVTGFDTQPVDNIQSSIIIEIDSKKQLYQLWYLFPVLIIITLFLVRIFLQK